MGKRTKLTLFSKDEIQMTSKYLKKRVGHMVGHHGNANQNCAEIPSHPNQNGYHPENTKHPGMVAKNFNLST